jgi:transposase-like protein
MEIFCPKCEKNEFWKTKDNRLKCKNCRHLFTPKENLFNIPNSTLRSIISEFLLEHSTNIILERIKISKYKLLKILNVLRILITKEVIKEFRGKIKLDEKFFEKEIENILKRRKTKKEKKLKNEELIIGIFCEKGKCYAKPLPNIKSSEIKSFLKKRKKLSFSENWLENIGLVFRGSLFRLTQTKKGIDILSVFWGYLKRKLSEKGGVRREKLPFYLGEYSFRFNKRKESLKLKEDYLFNLILEYSKNKSIKIK